MLQYLNGLLGKHFRVLQQLTVFHLDSNLDYSDIELDLWKAMGELGTLLWYAEINDMDNYLSHRGQCLHGRIHFMSDINSIFYF